MSTGDVERAIRFLTLSSKPCLVITAVEQHVAITFKIERSLCTETLKNSKIPMLPQLKILSYLTSYLLWNDCNRTGNSRLQPCEPGRQPYGKLSEQMFPPKMSILMNQHFNQNGQIILHQLQLTENPLMKVLAFTSPFNAVCMIYLSKLRRQVSTSVRLYPFQQHISTMFFTVRRTQHWQRMLLSQTFLESISESLKVFPKVFILILGFETHFTFAFLIPLNCLTSSAVRINM